MFYFIFGFQPFPSGSGEPFSLRIRIRAPKRLFKIVVLEVHALKNHFFGGPRAENSHLLEVRALKNHFSRFYRFYRIYRLYRYYRFYRFYTCATKETANIHTTHKGRTKVPMGRRASRAAPSVLLFVRAKRAPLCVWCECWRSLCVAQV